VDLDGLIPGAGAAVTPKTTRLARYGRRSATGGDALDRVAGGSPVIDDLAGHPSDVHVTKRN
jgi:hypothetical protein